MRQIVFGIVLSAAALLIAPTVSSAQWGNVELNIHGGVYQPDLGINSDALGLDDSADDTDTDPLVGGRLQYNARNGLGIGANFDWVFLDQLKTGTGDDIDINLYLYSGELHYTFPSASRVKFFAGAGVGGATRRISDLPGIGDRSSTDLLVPVVAGLKFVNDADLPRWGITIEGRDNIIWVDEFDATEGDTDKKATNTWALQGGISFFFGGGPRFVEQEPVRVEPQPEPVREQPPARVEPAPVVAPAACVDGRDWYRTDAPITVEGRTWVKFGTPTSVSPADLVQIGEFDDVPVYVRTTARAPYSEIYLPLCAPANTYQRYRPQREIRGTTG